MEKKSTVVNKIILLLSKVKEALIHDLKQEFIQVREAVANLNQETDDKPLTEYVDGMCDIVEAVFARVGYDISHYENIGELKNIVTNLIAEAEGLSNDLIQTVEDFEKDRMLDGDETAAMLDKVVPRIISIVDLVKTASNAEWEEISKELESAGNTIGTSIEEQFLNKQFARQILDHIIMTLLKNAKEVFKDEIDYVKMSIENHITALKDNIDDITEAITNEVNSALDNIDIKEIEDVLQETLNDARRLYDKVDGELKTTVANAIDNSSDKLIVEYNDSYKKLSKSLSITYSILDFLGVLKEKEITLQLPSKIKEIIGNVQDVIQNVGDKINDGVETITDGTAEVIESAQSQLNMTQQITGMGVAAISTTGIQIQTLDLFFQKGNNALETIASGFESVGLEVTGVVDEISTTLQDKLDSIKNFSYPIKLKVFNWQEIENLFTSPIKHFKRLYPIDSMADAEDLMRRIMDILHNINPDIPDFSSLKRLLEDLLKKLQQRVIKLVNELKEKAKESANEIWEKFQPIITTIRKVIDMLKDMASALKEKIGDVLDDVKDAVKEVVTVVQDQLKEIGDELGSEIKSIAEDIVDAGSAIKENVEDVLRDIDDKAEELTKAIKNGLNEVDNHIEDAIDNVGDEANEIISSIAEEVRNTIGKMPSFNLTKSIKNSLAEPLTDAVSDAFRKSNIDIDLSPFVELSNEKNELVDSIKRLNRNISKLQVEIPNISLSNALPSFDDIFGDCFPDILGIVHEEAIQPLQLWAYGVVKSVKTITDIDVWKSRLDNLISQLKDEFHNDLGNITGLISKEGAMKLFNDSNAVKEQLKNELDINDYITIVQTAIDDVVLPNPEYFFNSFKECLQNIFSNLTARLLREYQNLKDKLNDAFETMVGTFRKSFDNFIDQVEKVGGHMSDKAQKIMQDIKEVIENVKSLLNKMKDVFQRIKELPSDLIQKIKEGAKDLLKNLATAFVDGIEEFASNIWRSIKTQVIMPLINHIKSQILHCIKAIVKRVLRELVEAITVVKDTAEDTIETIFDKLPGLKDLRNAIKQFIADVKKVIDKSQQLGNKIKDILPEGRITNLNQMPAILKVISEDELIKEEFQQLRLTFQRSNGEGNIEIPYYYVNMTQSLISATLDFIQSDMSVKQIIKLIVSLYKGIPEEVKDKVMDFMPDLPDMPDNAFTDLFDDVTYSYDIDNLFCNVTLLNLKPKDGEDHTADNDINMNYHLTLQLFMFVGVYGKKAEAEFDALEDETLTPDVIDEEDESVPALYFIIHLRGNLRVVFSLGENHLFKIELEGGVGDMIEDDKEVTDKSLGFCMTEKDIEKGITSVFHGLGSAKSLDGLFMAKFGRNNGEDTKEKAGPAKLLATKYLDISIGDYPQTLYLLYNHEYPSDVIDALNLQDNEKIVDGFSVGYMAKLENVEFILKLRQNDFFAKVLKDDISAQFSLSVLYDYLRGFKLGGGYSYHLDIDCSDLQLGAIHLKNLGIDLGSLKNDLGTLNMSIGSTFSVNLGTINLSFENLGLGMNLNIVKKDFSIGDWDFAFKFKFPEGIGISIDTVAVKGAGMLTYSENTGELIGALELDVINKFGVSGLLVADLGTVEGHSFSLVAMISASFSPGIPLGMGFSLTAIGGALGLQRMLDRNAITNAVRQGTLDSVFFVDDINKHLAEMKQACESIFPAKEGQFFMGLIGQICYEPVVRCNFGLMMQLPNPIEIIIVGALKVGIEDTDIIRINVYFAGGINFEEGIWFDASIVDSEIVGIKMEGDMAFRLFWGGKCKGFLLSIGGFHPNYKPEEGMLVSDMKRLALKLDYSILKIGLDAYLAVTSNSFQIGANMDLCIGWEKFGITGYAGFDALFQFDPFMFMFSVEAGVSVVCGSWKLLSIDLSLDLSGPSPWKAAGDAKFWFILIPINLGFDISWGDIKPQLPTKQIEILPLFEKEIQNTANWLQEQQSHKDRDIIIRNAETEETLLISPVGSLSFNQCILPMEDKKMDLCNNAVPTDYNSIRIKYVVAGDTKIEINDDNHVENDFAPALYYLMSHEEKLKSPSYVNYKSGFKLDSKRQQGDCQILNVETEVTIGTYRNSDTDNISTGQVTSIRNKSDDREKTAYQKKNKIAFERYIDLLDNIK